MNVKTFLRLHQTTIMEISRLLGIPYATVRYQNKVGNKHLHNALESLSGKIERGLTECMPRIHPLSVSDRPECIIAYGSKKCAPHYGKPFTGFFLVDGKTKDAIKMKKSRLKKRHGYAIILYYSEPRRPDAEIWINEKTGHQYIIQLEAIRGL